jgi:hypothetical protein
LIDRPKNGKRRSGGKPKPLSQSGLALNRNGRLHELYSAEHLHNPKQRPTHSHPAKARRGLTVRKREEERERASASDKRDVLMNQDLTFALIER